MSEVPLYNPGPHTLSCPAAKTRSNSNRVANDKKVPCSGVLSTIHTVRRSPCKALRGGISKVYLEENLSTFGNKCPQNGSKNEPRAPRTSMGCPHEGPRVATCRWCIASWQRNSCWRWREFSYGSEPPSHARLAADNPEESARCPCVFLRWAVPVSGGQVVTVLEGWCLSWEGW